MTAINAAAGRVFAIGGTLNPAALPPARAVPEPTGLVLSSIGLLGLAVGALRQRRADPSRSMSPTLRR